MKHAILHTEGIAEGYRQRFQAVATANFFNARGTDLEKEPSGLFRSSLHQLFQQIRPMLSGFVPQFCRRKNAEKPGWT